MYVYACPQIYAKIMALLPVTVSDRRQELGKVECENIHYIVHVCTCFYVLQTEGKMPQTPFVGGGMKTTVFSHESKFKIAMTNSNCDI